MLSYYMHAYAIKIAHFVHMPINIILLYHIHPYAYNTIILSIHGDVELAGCGN